MFVSKHFTPAAYHGSGWLPREGTLADEIASGQTNRVFGKFNIVWKHKA